MKTEISRVTADDLHLFNEGNHTRLHYIMGAHPARIEGVEGTSFAVWAPNAAEVSVIGDFNGWEGGMQLLFPLGRSGVWEGFLPGVGVGASYKYHVVARNSPYRADKADPFGFFHEVPPRTGSIVWALDYDWDDQEWMATRARRNALDAPMAIYEVHLGSWLRPHGDERMLTYRELAGPLADYARRMGFTHVEFLPVMEHPFYGSWGYQVTGFFAPTSRYGPPQDFMYLVDHLHQNGIGVILDWVASHFPTDEHGLGYFDGTHLYEHADPRQGFHPDWDSWIFNYGRSEVRSFLLSNATFWLEHYHIDGLRVDAVASMLYLDYSREPGGWIPNIFGGRENLDAITLVRRFNQEVFGNHPDVQTFAEESTSWPMVSRPTYLGGLGFGMKWDMGWMHDTLDYLAKDPIYRKFHHNNLTFRLMYAHSENFVLPLSHDEVVYGKRSLLHKMPGDEWQRFANLRLLLGYLYAQPGKKLLFMGGEFGQWREWNHDTGLDWHLLQYPLHGGVAAWVADLNRFYTAEPALSALDFDLRGFEWIDCNDAEQSVLTLMRRGRSERDVVVTALNFTPLPREGYRVGVPFEGFWQEALNSDSVHYGGSGMGNLGGVHSEPEPHHGRPHSVRVTLPPLGVIFFRLQADGGAETAGQDEASGSAPRAEG